MQASIQFKPDATQQYLLRLGDTCLILAQRLSEWCGHGPVIEEDIALTNISLDLIGQSRALLSHVAQLAGNDLDEDKLAFLRDERDYVNLTMVELPRGDFAFTTLRNFLVSTLLLQVWEGLATSRDSELAAIAGKAVKEARYHQSHSADWVIRLGDGTQESHRRMEVALAKLWPYTAEFFDMDEVDETVASRGLAPRWEALRHPWLQQVMEVLQEATLDVPEETSFRSTAKRGLHSEHMGYILTEMQYLQRAYPGGVW